MAHIEIRRGHHLDHADMHRHVNELAQDLSGKYQADCQWLDDDTLVFSRAGASGRITIGRDEITIDVDLSLFLFPLKEQIEHTIHEHLDAYLDQA